MIVIPMAGLSSRFFKAGYSKPKYMLEAHGRTLFDHAVSSFEKYFEDEHFLFIARDVFDTPNFVEQQLKKIGVKNYTITTLAGDTRGQAETVFLGLKSGSYEGPITIFNIDTFRPDFVYPDLELLGDGFLEVFEGTGDNWSFVKPENNHSTIVVETTEKNPISNLCCTGLYHFSDINNYISAYNHYLELPEDEWQMGELYVAPLYNLLIQNGKKVHYSLIRREQVIFCGVPSEYDEFREKIKL